MSYRLFDSESTITTHLSELVDTGYELPAHQTAEYICHISTIPLCTVIDTHQGRKDLIGKVKSFPHAACTRNCCMFESTKSKKRELEFTLKDCPCCSHSRDVQRICWTSLLRSLKTKINPQGTIDPGKVMFCFDQRGILDDKYPTTARERTGASGIGHVNHRKIYDVLDQTFWYSRYGSQFKVPQAMKALEERIRHTATPGRAGEAFVEVVKQCLHTVNGILMKKMLCFSSEMSGYTETAQSTARLFRDLIQEHGFENKEEIPNESAPSAYAELKEFYGVVKQFHNHPYQGERLKVMDYTFKNRAVKTAFIKELNQLKRKVTFHNSSMQNDYTDSLAWDFRMKLLLQTRGLGYVPKHMGNQTLEEFFELTGRPVQEVPEEELKMIHDAVVKELRENGVKKDLLRDEKNFKEVIRDAMTLELKSTASLYETVASGGKTEDARKIFSLIRENKIQVPIRNLETFEVVGMTQVLSQDQELDAETIDASTILFWFALQSVLNFACIHKLMDERFYHLIKINETEFWYSDLLNSRLVAINEAGKLRILIKSHSVLNWFLAPGSKISQEILSMLPDHKAGLQLGAQDWNFEKRINGETNESLFMYRQDGRILDEIHMAYTDWRTATDLIPKRIGIQLLKTYFGYIGFPSHYAVLIMAIIRLPQPVEEVVWVDPHGEPKAVRVQRTINEGFMMGNQMTKTVLHLNHAAGKGAAYIYLESQGFRISRQMFGEKVPHRHIPFSAEFLGTSPTRS